MEQTNPPLRFEAVLAYALSGATSLLWVACVVPSGPLLDPLRSDEFATPMFREATLLVPSLLLLALLPVGFTLARRRSGLTALLASTDAFVALYAGVAFLIENRPLDPAGATCVSLLLLVAGLSGIEIWRSLTDRPADGLRVIGGVRLAFCLLILVVPSRFLLVTGAERASWLGPFVLIAISAAGARIATSDRGLRRTGALVQLAVAIHLAVTLRYTLFHDAPLFASLGVWGHLTLVLAGITTLLAALQMFVLMRSAYAYGIRSQGNSQELGSGPDPSVEGAGPD